MNPETILEVDAVSLYSFDAGKRVVIVASGRTSTTGWSHPDLKPVIYVHAPTDGIWDFMFVATPPSGPAAEVLSPIVAVAIWDCPSGAKGVRVRAKINAQERTIQTATLERERANSYKKDGPFPAVALGGEHPLPWLVLAPLGGDKPHPGPAIVAGGEKPYPGPTVVAGGDKPFPWGPAIVFGGDRPHPWAPSARDSWPTGRDQKPFEVDGVLAKCEGVGAETTGTLLKDVAMDVDVDGIANGNSLEGKRARYTGRFVHRHYVERGWVTTFVVTDVILLK